MEYKDPNRNYDLLWSYVVTTEAKAKLNYSITGKFKPVLSCF